MNEHNNLLNYYGLINAGFLHAYGKTGTEKLLQLIEFNRGDLVLEIGFGTGTTLVKIASENKDVKLYGIEQSEIMLNKAKRRINFSGVTKNIFLTKAAPQEKFPFDNGYFDNIIIESVLAIQDDASLQFLLSEIRRVLKPSGRIYLNETVWLESISNEEIEKMNSYCKNKFGIIQSNGTYKYRQNWKELLESNHLSVLKLESISEIEIKNKSQRLNIHALISKTYSFYGKIRSKLDFALRHESITYKKSMKNIFEDKQYLEGIIIVASKS
jgi:ubiquinone/menaquinone biosynthesis C-methylase UbiE